MIPLTRAIPEHIRGGYDDALYKSTFTLLYFYQGSMQYASKELSKPSIWRY